MCAVHLICSILINLDRDHIKILLYQRSHHSSDLISSLVGAASSEERTVSGSNPGPCTLGCGPSAARPTRPERWNRWAPLLALLPSKKNSTPSSQGGYGELVTRGSEGCLPRISSARISSAMRLPAITRTTASSRASNA